MAGRSGATPVLPTGAQMKIPQLIELDGLEPIDAIIAHLILETPAPGKHFARHALHHLKRAWEIKCIDPEMAVFRAITAEEEAATAIFHSLKRHKYPNAEKLNQRNHVHKAAVRVMFNAIKRGLATSGVENSEPQIQIDSNATPRRFQLGIKLPSEGGPPLGAICIPPLNFSLKKNGIEFNFMEQLEEIATEKGAKEVIDLMNKEANARNQLLYASTAGIPRLGDKPTVDEVLMARQRNVLSFLRTYLMIDPYPEHQIFVCQCLDIFLRAVNIVRERRKTVWVIDGEGI